MKLSLIIEMENLRDCNSVRSLEMMKQLYRQLRELNEAPATDFLATFRQRIEVIIAYNPQLIGEDELNNFLVESRLAELQPLCLVCEGCGYYGLKNKGAEQASGEIFIFLDSDVIPESDWLNNLLLAFEDEKKSVIGCVSYVEPNTLYDKLFILSGFFPLKPDERSTIKTNRLHANSLGVRKRVYRHYQFQADGRMRRDQCVIYAETLIKNGIPVYLCRSARLKHPSPLDYKRLIRFAYLSGCDSQLRREQIGNKFDRSILAILARFIYRLFRTYRKILYGFRQIRLPIILLPLSFLQGTCYYLLAFFGELRVKFSRQ
ncbi:MAG: glycosyltransferase [Calditrichaeota bacterium]|nr:glycosyltransferase [Calditrichota bacterium]